MGIRLCEVNWLPIISFSPDRVTYEYTYDPFGRLESITGPDNKTTTYHYDRLSRRVMVEDPSGQTSFEYDLWDNLIALTDAKNQRTEFEYYADGTLKLERRPMNEETTYEYDHLGRLWKVTDAKNQTTEYGYDAQSRIETIAYADGKTVTLSYDADGNLSGYSDGTTSASYTYDDMGRKLTETVNYGPFSKSFSYTYYGNGLKHTFTAPDSPVYTYLYGLNNELQEIQIPGVGSITLPNYTWNRPATVNYPGGTQRTSAYDSLMRIQSLTATDPGGTPLLNDQYTYDPVGNILTKTTEHGNYSYGYDAVSRLLTADNPMLADESYTYDDVGNRLTSADVSGSWSYNLNNELLGYEDVGYEYDENGNLTEIRIAGSPVWTYTYDAANRLVHVEDGTGTINADYYYDPFGRRLWKEVSGTRTYFFYSEEGLIAEYDASGVEIRSYGYRPDSTWTTDPLFQKVGSTYYWYQNDHLGTPQKLTAQDGTMVWSAQYTAFGEADVQVETVVNNLRLPGQFFDEETELYYNGFRYYDPKIGRYLTTDPIRFAGGDMNLYGFVFNNPIAIIDPLGLQCKEVRLIVHTIHGNENSSHTHTFASAAKYLAEQYAANKNQDEKARGVEEIEIITQQVSTGKQIVELINKQAINSIISLDVFSHSNIYGIHISKDLKPSEPSWWLKKQFHMWIRSYDEREAKDMEESYHGLYSDWTAGWVVGWYFNQKPGEGRASLAEVYFYNFTRDAKVEFHGCKTTQLVAYKGIPIIGNNFTKLFSLHLESAGKVDAEVIGHVGLSGPPQGGSYQWGPRRVYQGGVIIREIEMGNTPFWHDYHPGEH